MTERFTYQEEDEAHRAENRRIANRIKTLVETNMRGSYAFTAYTRESSPTRVLLNMRDTVQDAFIAKHLSMPVMVFQRDSLVSLNKQELGIDLVLSPYGVLPDIVIGADGHFYQLSNDYYFDLNGKAIAHDSVYRFKSPYQRKNAMQLDFIPSEGDSLYRNLTGGDYENIGYYLQGVENGEFKRIVFPS